ncbi:pilus assembly protein [Sphingopyxis sp. XHP0097]|jgi:Flp pilus assembly protein TadG|uniref:Pilus assembly protein n=1 Tax=Sphingopyxis jiangsuensis TaxID=2871171 RepID=A0ABS7MGB7_9SPHN|nr:MULTISPECIES: TadE family protein [Sphingopyxis]MBL0769165.1 pilus assembly protein [Sphingopyxis lutea]MBY4637729.1 pilus assembly protein [Sphingopyxis jiangsuensis]
MIKFQRNLFLRTEGSAAVEAALALPVLFAFIGVIFMLGNLLLAQASVDHATGEAARYSTIYPTPSAADIEAKARAALFDSNKDAVRDVDVTMGVDDGRKFAEITITYDYPVISWFVEGSEQTLTHSRRAYLP